jgi:putative ABC transport system permease protein
MLRLEAALVITVAATLGSAIALAVLTAFASGMTGSAEPTVEPLRALAVIGSAAILALAATLVPARLRTKGTASPGE